VQEHAGKRDPGGTGEASEPAIVFIVILRLACRPVALRDAQKTSRMTLKDISFL